MKVIKLTRTDGLDAWIFLDHITGIIQARNQDGSIDCTHIYNYGDQPWEVTQTPEEIGKMCNLF